MEIEVEVTVYVVTLVSMANPLSERYIATKGSIRSAKAAGAEVLDNLVWAWNHGRDLLIGLPDGDRSTSVIWIRKVVL